MSEPKKPGTALATNDLSREDLFKVLKSSLYPGAKDGSVALVLDYCTAAGLDVMKKPVHIVPMKVKSGEVDDRGFDIMETRDVVMPGIGLYRTEASRTGQYVGLSEPEFGPMMELEYDEEVWSTDERGKRVKTTKRASMDYPDWCRITIQRLVAGEVRSFTAKEYWIENYATKGKGDAPNEMWRRRPMGQLAKCTEAQALRKGFPDTTGSQATAEELEGRTSEIHMGQADEVGKPKADDKKDGDKKKDDEKVLPVWTDELFKRQYKNAKEAIQGAGRDPEEVIRAIGTRGRLTDEQAQSIRDLATVTDVVPKGEAPAASTAAAAADADGVLDEPLTYAVLVTRVVNAKTTEELDDVMPLVQHIPAEQRETLFDKIDDQRSRLLG